MYLLRIKKNYNNNFQIYFLSHLFVYFYPIRLFYCNIQYNSTIHWVLLGKADSMKQPVRKSKVFFALCDSPFECFCSPNNALKSARSFCWFCLSKEKSESMNRAITPHTHKHTSAARLHRCWELRRSQELLIPRSDQMGHPALCIQ